MKIRSFEVTGLFGKDRKLSLKFHNDLNILTGYNGSGKTTVMKLLWYVLSGNIHVALREIPFRRCVLETDAYKLQVLKIGTHTCEATVEENEIVSEFEDRIDESNDIERDARDDVKEFTQARGSTLFFPTFRRIEGGFGVDDASVSPRNSFLHFAPQNETSDLQKAVAAVSRRLSNGAHTFVTSIATNDISELIQSKYTDLSEQANATQRKANENVVAKIQDYKRVSTSETISDLDKTSKELLDEVQNMIESVNDRRNAIMAPLVAVQELATKIFRHSGIKVSGRVSFGDAASAISSDKLSAGEKQMLSFICYNAMTNDSVIFIDEPELSLHVDWQRTLFPTLMAQNKNNQFIIATHSPFIYSNYVDKEIQLAPLRGDEGE